MKRILIGLAIAAVAAGCNSQAENKSQMQAEQVRIIRDSLKLDSFKRAEAARIEAEQARKDALAAEKAENYNQTTTSSGASHSAAQQQPAKKGWSNAAKGAVIGAGAGAVTGVLVDKKNVRGAVIGGAVGAGTGYVIGRAKDRKTGRVQPKN